MSYKSLSELRDEVMARSRLNMDYATTLPALIEGMTSPTKINSPDGELVLTPNGFRQLVRERLGLAPAIFEHAGIKNETKLQVLRDVAETLPDKEVRVRRSGNMIDGVVSNEYVFFDNRMLVHTLAQMQQDGLLPGKVEAMQFYLSSSGRDMQLRLVAPEAWNFMLPERNGNQPFLGNLVISNNELGLGSFSAKVAVTRHACLNSTIGSSVWKVDHRLASYDDFVAALKGAVDHISLYAKEMMEVMQSLQRIEISSPLLVFEKVGSELGVPKYALNAAKTYYENEGSGSSMYDIVQAVSAGLRDVTVAAGRRQPNWDKRSVIEANLWTTALAINGMTAEGESIEAWYMDEKASVKEACARYVSGFNGMVEEAEMIANGIRELELA